MTGPKKIREEIKKDMITNGMIANVHYVAEFRGKQNPAKDLPPVKGVIETRVLPVDKKTLHDMIRKHSPELNKAFDLVSIKLVYKEEIRFK